MFLDAYHVKKSSSTSSPCKRVTVTCRSNLGIRINFNGLYSRITDDHWVNGCNLCNCGPTREVLPLYGY